MKTDDSHMRRDGRTGHAAHDTDAAGTTVSARAAGPRRIHSTSLFREDREVIIVHRGQEYRLRVTKTDKLILTK